MSDKMIIIGCRGSKLSLKQAEMVKSKLLDADASLQIDFKIIKTMGDKVQDVSLEKLGGEGVFVKEIEEALLNHTIDLAVHSMKDLPTAQPKGLVIGAVLERTEYRDAFVSKHYASLSELPSGSVIGTSSLRRKVQIASRRSDIIIKDVRGNVDTRLKKLDDGQYDAIIISSVGLDRLGLQHRIRERLDFVPAVAQGAIAIEMRANDERYLKILGDINHEASRIETNLERLFLKQMGGGCQVPLGALAKKKKNTFSMKCFIGSLDGKKIIEHKVQGFLAQAEALIVKVGQKILNEGGKEILESVYNAP